MTVRILRGDCRDVLKTLPDESVHCVVTSPPYWGLRDYGVEGQLGLEPTVCDYIEKMVAVFEDVRRVLRSDGTLWLNMGDCYATGAGKVGAAPGGGEQGGRWLGDVGRHRDAKRRDNGRPGTNGRGEEQVRPTRVGPMTQPNRMPQPGLKPKDLVGQPWRLAFALQAAGWWLRQDIIWHKPAPMPESIRDRCTKSHEYLFLLAKSERYYFDADAIAEDAASGGAQRVVVPDGWATGKGKKHDAVSHSRRADKLPPKDAGLEEQGLRVAARLGGGAGWRKEGRPAKRNKRSVWTVASKPFSEAHFATFPPALIEPCILAGAPRGGVVLDPFGGAGTTGLVADRHGRDAVLIELNPEYADMAERRITGDSPLFSEVAA